MPDQRTPRRIPPQQTTGPIVPNLPHHGAAALLNLATYIGDRSRAWGESPRPWRRLGEVLEELHPPRVQKGRALWA